MLQFVGLREERYRRIREYSTGMRQRIKLAQAIVHDPPLCFLDEPTSGLDPKGREEMLDLIRSLARLGGRSFVLSTHLLPDADGLCDQVLLLNAGRCLATGPVAQLLSGSGTETVVRIQGESEPFLAHLAQKGLAPRRATDGLRITISDGDYRPVFEAAVETGAQIRYLGRSVSSIEGLFLSRLDRPEAGGGS